MTQNNSPIVQIDDYYPFGLSFNSYRRENGFPNRHLYNKGSERQDDLELGVYLTYFRVLDPALGRWWQVDPKPSEGISVYVSMDDNPVLHNDPLGDRIKIYGDREDRRQVRRWLREIKNSSEEGRQAVKDLRKSPNVHKIHVVQYKYPGVGQSEDQYRSSKDERAKEALDQKRKMLAGKTELEREIINDVASGGRPATINNSLKSSLKNLNAYNGNGTGSDIYINKGTSFANFTHEIGHAQSADKGTMDKNTVSLAAVGFNDEWIRIKDEKTADTFASKVIGGSYSDYGFSAKDQQAYDKAVAELPKN